MKSYSLQTSPSCGYLNILHHHHAALLEISSDDDDCSCVLLHSKTAVSFGIFIFLHLYFIMPFVVIIMDLYLFSIYN